MSKNLATMQLHGSRTTVMLLSGIFCVAISFAQQTVISSGGTATGSGGSATYSIGQVVYTAYSANSGSVSQGVQQAYEIYVLSVEDLAINLSMDIYPNPTSNQLTLRVSELKGENLSYRLIDMQGKKLSSGDIVTTQTPIDVRDLERGSYFLTVFMQENKKVQSFKIIKN